MLPRPPILTLKATPREIAKQAWNADAYTMPTDRPVWVYFYGAQAVDYMMRSDIENDDESLMYEVYAWSDLPKTADPLLMAVLGYHLWDTQQGA